MPDTGNLIESLRDTHITHGAALCQEAAHALSVHKVVVFQLRFALQNLLEVTECGSNGKLHHAQDLARAALAAQGYTRLNKT